MARRTLALLAALVLTAACASQEDVDATEAALADLAAELEARDDLEDVRASLDTTTGTPLPSQISVSAQGTAEDPEAVAATIRDVAAAAWASDVPSITHLWVRVRPAGADRSLDLSDAFGGTTSSLTRDQLEQELGPRDR